MAIPQVTSVQLLYSLVCVAAVLLVGVWLYRKSLPQPIPGIPYNREATTRITGDVPEFMKWRAERSELYSWIASQCVQLDSPIIQLFMRPFGRPWVAIADFREAQDILMRRTQGFDRSEFFGELFKGILPYHQVHMPTGDEWRAHRKLMADTMSPRFLNEVASYQMYAKVLDLVDLWKEKARLADSHPFPVLEDIKRGTFDIIYSSTIDLDAGAVSSETSVLRKLGRKDMDLPKNADSSIDFPDVTPPPEYDSLTTLIGSVEIATNSPVPRQHHWLALRLYPYLRRARRYKDSLLREALDQAWKKFSSNSTSWDGQIKSAIDLIVQKEVAMAAKEGRAPQYRTPAIQDELFGFLAAGLDTSAATISWGVKYLADCQEAQRTLRSALRAHHDRAFKLDENPAVEEIAKANIPYLNAVIEEILRLGGAVPSLMRRTRCDARVLGHVIPKGTDVFLLSNGPDYVSEALTVDEASRSQSGEKSKDRYGRWQAEDIGEFKPERWLSKNDNGEEEFNAIAGPMHAFGTGPRSCFGQKFADLELKFVFTLLVWNFELKPAGPELSSYIGHDKMVHAPQQCYLRLSEAR